MANTKAVNFRADAMFYQKTKEVLADEKISVVASVVGFIVVLYLITIIVRAFSSVLA